MTYVKPAVMSKSSTKALACDYHFHQIYVEKAPALRRMVSPMADVGTAYHLYRAEYQAHLVEIDYRRDPDWAKEWLESHSEFTQEAIDLISDDIRTFEIDPSIVLGIEMGLSIDSEMNPVERVDRCIGPFISTDPRATDSGTLDLLLMSTSGDRARVVDYKSGYSTASLTDLEPPRYAGLVFAHFPRVQRVEFLWELPRLRATKSAEYSRDDLPQIKKAFAKIHGRAQRIVDQANAGGPESLSYNPFSGMCSFCALNCPLKREIAAGKVAIPPLQTATEARRAAQVVVLAKLLAAEGAKALRGWVEAQGRLDCGDGWEVRIGVGETKSLPLAETLKVLGLEAVPSAWLDQWVEPSERPRMPDTTPLWDIPAKDLILRAGAINGKAKAKKRAGMPEALAMVADVKPKTKLVIARGGEKLPMIEEED